MPEYNKIANAVGKSYEKHSNIYNISFQHNPCIKDVKDIINKFFHIIFPCYQSNTKSDVLILLEELYTKLEDQIYKAYLSVESIIETDLSTNVAKISAIEIASEFISQIPHIRDEILSDIKFAYNGDPAASSYHEIILSYPFIKSLVVHQISHFLYMKKIPIIPRMISEWAHSKTGIDIHPGAKIGKKFFIDHGTGVVIGETTVIGNNVKIYQGVTLGAISFEKDELGKLIKGTKRHPTLEDNVIVYANATILGGNTVIGRNSIIGGNTWIINSVQENSVVTINDPNLLIQKRKSRSYLVEEYEN